MPTDIARYSIELFKLGGEEAGIEEILDRHADLKIAQSIYRARVEKYPDRLIMLWPAAIARSYDSSGRPPSRSGASEILDYADQNVPLGGGSPCRLRLSGFDTVVSSKPHAKVRSASAP
jgi:hypothetical protein